MWMRSLVFDHGSPHLSGSVVGGCAEAETRSKWGKVGKPEIKLLGRIVVEMRKADVEHVLQPLAIRNGGRANSEYAEEIAGVCEALGELLFEATNQTENSNHHLEMSECLALSSLFCTIQATEMRMASPNAEAKSLEQLSGELTLFLLAQMWHEVRLSRKSRYTPDVWQDLALADSGLPHPSGLAEASDSKARETGIRIVADEGSVQPLVRSPRSLGLDLVGEEREHRLEFLRLHIREIMWLLSLSNSEDVWVEKAAFLENFDSNSLSVPLAMALQFLVTEENDNLKIQGDTVSCTEIESAILSSLGINESVSPVLVPQEAHSAPDVPRSTVVGDLEYFNIAYVKRSTAVFGSGEENELRNQAVEALNIFDCNNASIYFLRPCKYVRIVGCNKCTIVLGPCAGIVTIEHSKELQIIGIAAQVGVSNSYDLRFSMHMFLAFPVISGDCRNLEFGPYCTYYPRLLHHLALVRVDPPDGSEVHRWSQPINITSKLASHVWTLQQPSDLGAFVIPFNEPPPLGFAPCTENPYRLPQSYALAIHSRVLSVERILRLVTNATPPPPPKGESKEQDPRKVALEKAIEASFRDWLLSSGNHRQLLDLVKLN